MRKLNLFTEKDFDKAMDKAGLKKEDYTEDQLTELYKGAKNKVDITIFSNPTFDALQMQMIRWGLEEGVNAALYADPKKSYNQMQKEFIQLEREISYLGEFDLLLADVV